MTHTIYALVDPRNQEVRYVGITIDVYERFKQHIRCDGCNPEKDFWMHELQEKQIMVIMQSLEKVDTFEQALDREQYWIRHYSHLGIQLLNSQERTSGLRIKVRVEPVYPHNLALYDGARVRHSVDETNQILDYYLLTGLLPSYVSDRQRYSYRHHKRLPERKRLASENQGYDWPPNGAA